MKSKFYYFCAICFFYSFVIGEVSAKGEWWKNGDWVIDKIYYESLAGSDGFIATYTYDNNWNMIKIEYGNNGTILGLSAYTYDNNGNSMIIKMMRLSISLTHTLTT